MNIVELVAAQREALLAGDVARWRALRKQWKAAGSRLDVLIRNLQRQVEAATAAGTVPTVATVERLAAYRIVRAELDAVYNELAAVTGDLTQQGARTALASGLDDVAAQLSTAGRTVNQFRALTVAASITDSASPLTPVLNNLTAGRAQQAADLIVDGFTTGRPLRVTSRELAKTFNADAQRARTIVRSETMRTYRETAAASYEAEDIRQWRWLSALSARTCASCWAMHGTIHSTANPMGTHPNCRCTMVPLIPGVSADMEAGVDVFDRLPVEDQIRVLGPSAHAAYVNGDIRLSDLVRRRQSPTWGTTRSRGSLRAARARAGRRR